jgi:hypothetical protein
MSAQKNEHPEQLSDGMALTLKKSTSHIVVTNGCNLLVLAWRAQRALVCGRR